MPKFKVTVDLEFVPQYVRSIEVEVDAENEDEARDLAGDMSFAREFRDFNNALDDARPGDWDETDSNTDIIVTDVEEIEPEENEEATDDNVPGDPNAA